MTPDLIKWTTFICKDCNYTVIVIGDAIDIKFCPECDSVNLEVTIDYQ